MDEKTIVQGLDYISLAVGERLTPERKVVYVEQLRDLGNDKGWEQCVLDLAGHVTAFPKLPEIREAYRAAVARQPQRDALEEHKPTPEERKQIAETLRKWMAETFPVLADMNSRVGPGGHVWGAKREIRPMEYEPRELPGGGIPSYRRPFGERD